MPNATSSQRLVIDDFDDLCRVFRRWRGQFLQLSRGRFTATVEAAQGEAIRLFRVQTNQQVRTLGVDDPTTCTLIPITPALAQCVWQNRRVASGRLLVRGTNIPYNNCVEPHARLTGFLVPGDRLRQAYTALTGTDAGLDLANWSTVLSDPTALAAVLAKADAFLSAVGSEKRMTEHACLHQLVRCLAARPATVEAAPRRAMLAGRALELIHATPDRPLSMLELCSAVGANGRTLRLAFQERFDTGPIAYHRLVRLHAVRAALRDEEPARIREAAFRFGFMRLGSFAAEYRLQFGELPSETLRGRTKTYPPLAKPAIARKRVHSADSA